ncbi:MAG: hypothetical protein V4608_11815 [Bacteroidota bacterium]
MGRTVFQNAASACLQNVMGNAMTYDINSYEIFLSGRLGPIRHTKFDADACKAEKKFSTDLLTFRDEPLVFFKVKLEDVVKNPNKIDEILNEMNLIELGFNEGENISVAIDTEEIDEEGRIEIRIKSEEDNSCPSMDSQKSVFFDKERAKIKSAVKRDLKNITLGFDSEEKVNAYISQQYQFAYNYYNEFKRIRKSCVSIGESFNKFSDKKKPLETNALIFLFLMTDIRNLMKFMEDNYPFYLKSKIISFDDKPSATTAVDNTTPIVPEAQPSKWRTIFNIDNLELKPNFAGIGINLNEIIKKWSTRQ